MSGFDLGESVSVAVAVASFGSLRELVARVDVFRCDPNELQALTAGVREGQEALDRLLIRVGVAADRQEQDGVGRGAQATMLGYGSRVRGQAARREAARSETAAAMPNVGEAVEQGRIGAAQIDAISAAMKDLDPEQKAQLDTDDLIEAGETLPADSFARRVRDEVERVKGDHGLADTKARQARSSWKHWTDRKTGMGRISAEFDPERFEAIMNAVEAHTARLANEGGVSKDSNLTARAAHELLTGKAARAGGLPHINVIVDHDTMRNGAGPMSLRETAAGHSLPPESIARLACDAVLQRVVVDKHRIPIDVGRKHRTATDAQWQSLRAMYRSCVWKGCDRPLAWCQAHHIHEWEHRGHTDLCNLIPLCSQHHHAVHEGRWSVKLCPQTRRLDIYDPSRTFWATTTPDRIRAAGTEGERRTVTKSRGPTQPEGP